MREAYAELLEPLAKGAQPFQSFTLQYSFIFYLVLGQFVTILLWRMCIRGDNTSHLKRVAFAAYLLAAQVALFFAWPLLVAWVVRAEPMFIADVVVTFHFLLIVSVPAMLLVILVGGPLGWGWVRNFWLRLLHLIVIEVVAGQAIVGIECPLTTLERHFRGGYEQLHNFEGASAIGIWCNEVVFYSGMGTVFLIVYAVVGLLVLLTWALVPPRFPWRERDISHKMNNGSEKTPASHV